MKLGLRLLSDAAVVYREKWGAIAVAFGAGVALVGFSLFFYNRLTEARGFEFFSSAFLVVFGGVGALLLVGLPRQARTWIAQDGVNIVVANGAGLVLAPYLGSRSRLIPWAGVAEIALTERLKIVGSDETAYCRCQLIVFLSPGQAPPARALERISDGVSHSGWKRPYLMVDYPKHLGRETQAALRRFAPADVSIKRYCSIVFDQKRGADTYVEA